MPVSCPITIQNPNPYGASYCRYNHSCQMSLYDTAASWLSLPSTATSHINIMTKSPYAHNNIISEPHQYHNSWSCARNNIMSGYNGIHQRTYPIMTNGTYHRVLSYCITTTRDVIMALYNIGYINKSLYNAVLYITTHLLILWCIMITSWFPRENGDVHGARISL